MDVFEGLKESQLLNDRQAAQWLGVSLQGLRYWRYSIPPKRPGGRIHRSNGRQQLAPPELGAAQSLCR